jgi:hypothetical protein
MLALALLAPEEIADGETFSAHGQDSTTARDRRGPRFQRLRIAVIGRARAASGAGS